MMRLATGHAGDPEPDRETAAPAAPAASHGPMTGRTFEVCIDANDPERLRPFWITALNYIEHLTAEGVIDLVDPTGRGPTIWFQRVPETKTAKNRLHLDIHVPPTERVTLTARLVELGGTVTSTHPRFTFLADPEGNEVCLTDQ
jgi:4a-hydroxytetrahydrobiopterin dehydratase